MSERLTPIREALSITLQHERVELLPHRALHWPRTATVYIADVHCGKAATFRARHIPIPEGNMSDDLARLSAVLQQTRARRLVILGDWIHAAVGCTPVVVDCISEWRKTHPTVAITWVKGNHDRVPRTLADSFDCATATLIDEGPFRFQHVTASTEGQFTIGGHEHPVVRLWNPGMPRMTVPCFHTTAHRLVLPAFGSFTGGHQVEMEPSSRVFLVADQSVIEWAWNRSEAQSQRHPRSNLLRRVRTQARRDTG